MPPGIFDAAEDTVDWTIRVGKAVAVAGVRAATIGPQPAAGVAVRLVCGALSGAGVLDAGGRAGFALVDSREQPVTETAAWQHDWASHRS